MQLTGQTVTDTRWTVVRISRSHPESPDLKTIRRRAANALLRWEPAGPNHEYRVIVRNQDTGERLAIYDGFQTECRLPPEQRLTSDLLVYRVMVRPIDDPAARFSRHQDPMPIPRLGDDYQTPADDLLEGSVVKGATRYRLLVRDKATGRPVVDLVRPEPRFLLPPGLLRDGDFEYFLMPRVHGRWKGRKGRPVTASMIAAADARAATPVPLPRDEPPRIKGNPATVRPGRPERLGPEGAFDAGPRVLVAVEVTAAPELSPLADRADIAGRQWWSGDGSGAVEAVTLLLEAHNLPGLFLLDVLAGEALGYDQVKRLSDELRQRGHGLGLMVNTEPWRAISPRLAEMSHAAATEEAFERFVDAVGRPPEVLFHGRNHLDADALDVARGLGVRVVIADRAAQLGLPAWMRWRPGPFAAHDDLAVLPVSMILSTPAHDRDRVVTHALRAEDPLTAGMAETVARALGQAEGGAGLIIARINPLALLLRQTVRSAEQAQSWNSELAKRFPKWIEAGWDRNPNGYAILDDRDEIRGEMITSLVSGLARAGIPPADLATAFSPQALRRWCEPARGYDELIEQRRAPRLLRYSGVRRYDAAFLQALKVDAA